MSKYFECCSPASLPIESRHHRRYNNENYETFCQKFKNFQNILIKQKRLQKMMMPEVFKTPQPRNL